MKLDATYSIADVAELIKADLAGKGFNLVGEPDLSELVDFKISFPVENKPKQVRQVKPYAERAVTEKELTRRKEAGDRLRNINKAKLNKNPPVEPEPEEKKK
jgi:hypothetical protein